MNMANATTQYKSKKRCKRLYAKLNKAQHTTAYNGIASACCYGACKKLPQKSNFFYLRFPRSAAS